MRKDEKPTIRIQGSKSVAILVHVAGIARSRSYFSGMVKVFDLSRADGESDDDELWIKRVAGESALLQHLERITDWTRDTGCLEADLRNDPEAFNELVEHLVLRKFEIRRLGRVLGLASCAEQADGSGRVSPALPARVNSTRSGGRESSHLTGGADAAAGGQPTRSGYVWESSDGESAFLRESDASQPQRADDYSSLQTFGARRKKQSTSKRRRRARSSFRNQMTVMEDRPAETMNESRPWLSSVIGAGQDFISGVGLAFSTSLSAYSCHNEEDSPLLLSQCDGWETVRHGNRLFLPELW